jgi:hypothetical protein
MLSLHKYLKDIHGEEAASWSTWKEILKPGK